MFLFLVFLGLVFIALEFLSFEVKYIIPLSLMVLSPIPLLIGKVLKETKQLECSNKMLNCSISDLKQLMNQSDINKIIKRFRECEVEIDEKIRGADKIYLLSRTGQKWWEHHLKGKLMNQDLYLLVLDPRYEKDSAFRMHFTSDIEMDKNNQVYPDILELERKKAFRFLNNLVDETKFQIRVLNYLPAWSLLIIDNSITKKHSGQSIIFCELAPYNFTSGNRPIFKITEDHNTCFKFFKNEFDELWERAKDDSWIPIEIK
jgi:hypothetical protein